MSDRKQIQILPGIKAIGWVDCDKLSPMLVHRAICGMPVPVLTEVTAVAHFGKCKCRRTTEKKGGQRVEQSSLSFSSDELLPINRHIGFVVTDVDGGTWLIGAREAPYPKVKVTADCGSVDGDSAGFNYEVTHEHLRTLMACDA